MNINCNECKAKMNQSKTKLKTLWGGGQYYETIWSCPNESFWSIVFGTSKHSHFRRIDGAAVVMAVRQLDSDLRQCCEPNGLEAFTSK